MRALPRASWRFVRAALTAPWHFVLRRWIRADLVDSDAIVLTDHGSITLGEIRGSGLVGRTIDAFCMVVQMVFGLGMVGLAAVFVAIYPEFPTWRERLGVAAAIVGGVALGAHMIAMPISWWRWAHRHPDLARSRRT